MIRTIGLDLQLVFYAPVDREEVVHFDHPTRIELELDLDLRDFARAFGLDLVVFVSIGCRNLGPWTEEQPQRQ